jgi:hypothetical protein
MPISEIQKHLFQRIRDDGVIQALTGYTVGDPRVYYQYPRLTVTGTWITFFLESFAGDVPRGNEDLRQIPDQALVLDLWSDKDQDQAMSDIVSIWERIMFRFRGYSFSTTNWRVTNMWFDMPFIDLPDDDREEGERETYHRHLRLGMGPIYSLNSNTWGGEG